MTGIFYSWDRSIFQYQTMCKSSVELGLVYKRLSTNTLEKLRCCPGKTNCIHCLHNAGFFGKLNKVIFPSQPKTHFFRDILPERVLCSAAEWSALMGALLLMLWSMRARARSSGRNAHIRSSTRVYVMKSHDRKKLSETCTNLEVRFLAQKYSVRSPNCFLKLCPCLAWESNSLTV